MTAEAACGIFICVEDFTEGMIDKTALGVCGSLSLAFALGKLHISTVSRSSARRLRNILDILIERNHIKEMRGDINGKI